ncbi:MAG: hypothetical protein AAF490_19660 [Chloroflexota bacterium]
MNDLMDRIGHFLGEKPGLLPLIGVGLILLNFILQLFPSNWIADVNLLLHLGLIVSILGILLIRPLE